jgi:hypothetical protein
LAWYIAVSASRSRAPTGAGRRGLHHGDADARAGRDLHLADRDGLAQRLHQPLAGGPGTGDVGHRGDDDELVPAEPGDGVGRPAALPQPAGHGDEHLVSDGVPEAVVDVLEPVEVDEEHREQVLPVEALQPRLQPLHQGRAVRQAGELVVGGAVAQLVLQQPPPGHVGLDDHRAAGQPVHPGHLDGRGPLRAGVEAAALQPGERAAAGEHLLDLDDEGLHVEQRGGAQAAQPVAALGHRPADAAVPLGQARRPAAVRRQHPAGGVDDGGAVVHGVHQALGEPLLRHHRGPGRQHLGEVAVHGDQPLRLPVGVAAGAHPHLHLDLASGARHLPHPPPPAAGPAEDLARALLGDPDVVVALHDRLVQRPAHRRVGRHAVDPFGRPVPGGDHTGAVDGDHRVADGVQHARLLADLVEQDGGLQRHPRPAPRDLQEVLVAQRERGGLAAAGGGHHPDRADPAPHRREQHRAGAVLDQEAGQRLGQGVQGGARGPAQPQRAPDLEHAAQHHRHLAVLQRRAQDPLACRVGVADGAQPERARLRGPHHGRPGRQVPGRVGEDLGRGAEAVGRGGEPVAEVQELAHPVVRGGAGPHQRHAGALPGPLAGLRGGPLPHHRPLRRRGATSVTGRRQVISESNQKPRQVTFSDGGITRTA